MDDASIEYLRRLAERLYNDALDFDRVGSEDMATAHLELAMFVQTEIAGRGEPVFVTQAFNEPEAHHLDCHCFDGGDVCKIEREVR